jgi:hypothetical protein
MPKEKELFVPPSQRNSLISKSKPPNYPPPPIPSHPSATALAVAAASTGPPAAPALAPTTAPPTATQIQGSANSSPAVYTSALTQAVQDASHQGFAGKQSKHKWVFPKRTIPSSVKKSGFSAVAETSDPTPAPAPVVAFPPASAPAPITSSPPSSAPVPAPSLPAPSPPSSAPAPIHSSVPAHVSAPSPISASAPAVVACSDDFNPSQSSITLNGILQKLTPSNTVPCMFISMVLLLV